MPGQLMFHLMSAQQQEWTLDLILRNRKMYEEFLAFAEKRHLDENVRFLRTMSEVPWNGQTPLSVGVSQGVYATYVKPGAFYQVNLDSKKADDLKGALAEDQPADWGPAVTEIRRLLRSNRLITDFLAERENNAQAALR
jgi:hypothetical protein